MEHKDDTFDNPILKKILESENHDVESIIVLQGLSRAVIGVSERWGEIPKLVYDKDIIFDILVNDEGMSEDEATEHFYYNILGTYMGEGTPVYIADFRSEA